MDKNPIHECFIESREEIRDVDENGDVDNNHDNTSTSSTNNNNATRGGNNNYKIVSVEKIRELIKQNKNWLSERCEVEVEFDGDGIGGVQRLSVRMIPLHLALHGHFSNRRRRRQERQQQEQERRQQNSNYENSMKRKRIDVEVIRLMIEASPASIYQPTEIFDRPDLIENPLMLALRNGFDDEVLEVLIDNSPNWMVRPVFSIILSSQYLSEERKQRLFLFVLEKSRQCFNGNNVVTSCRETWKHIFKCAEGCFNKLQERKGEGWTRNDVEWLKILNHSITYSTATPGHLRLILEKYNSSNNITNKNDTNVDGRNTLSNEKEAGGTMEAKTAQVQEAHGQDENQQEERLYTLGKLFEPEYIYFLIHAVCHLHFAPPMLVIYYLKALEMCLSQKVKMNSSNNVLTHEELSEKRKHLIAAFPRVRPHDDNVLHTFVRCFSNKRKLQSWKQRRNKKDLSSNKIFSSLLHRICKFYPPWLRQVDDDGNYPIHLACKMGIPSSYLHRIIREYNERRDILRQMVAASLTTENDGKNDTANVGQEDQPGETNCVFVRNAKGQYPLHVAVNHCGNLSPGRLNVLMGGGKSKTSKRTKKTKKSKSTTRRGDTTKTAATKRQKLNDGQRPSVEGLSTEAVSLGTGQNMDGKDNGEKRAEEENNHNNDDDDGAVQDEEEDEEEYGEILYNGEALLLGAEDPTTGLIPFLGAAAAKENSLSIVYAILRSDPSQIRNLVTAK